MPGTLRPFSRTPLLIAGLFLASAAPTPCQSVARVRGEENFRREPNGVVLARLGPGTPVSVVDRTDDWLQVDVEGWVWLNSLQASDTEFDLVVSADGGENLRAGPSGDVLGRLEEGALLDEIGREPGWAHVRRRGWIWSPSVEETSTEVPAPLAAAPGPVARQPEGFTNVGAQGAPILTSPDGDTLALAAPRSDLEVVSREGNWARVRLEGWVWMPPAAQPTGAGETEPSALAPEDLSADPQAHIGRVVSWNLQFISLEKAEAIRTDFREGEPFLLTRFGGPDGPFVYVAVPPERLVEAQGLVPLERISVTARIRTGASSLTQAPIVDLLTLENAR